MSVSPRPTSLARIKRGWGNSEGREAVAVVRGMMGPTDGAKAAPGTIRGDFGLSVQNNLIHGSDSPENAALEIGLWFQPEELISWAPADQTWVG